MKKIIALSIISISSCSGVSFAYSRHRPTPPPIVIVEPTPTASTAPTPSASASPSDGINYGEIKFIADPYFTTVAERALIAKAGKKMNEVVHSKCFYDFMANRKMIQTGGKTSKQVATEFVTVSGTIPVQFYYAYNSAVAYRQPPSNVIHINRRFYGPDSDLCEISSTFAHESLGHSILNYDHDYRWSASREYSVPYSANHAFSTESYSMSDSGGCCK